MEKLVAEFKAKVSGFFTGDDHDTSRPFKKSKVMEIRVTEREGNAAEVELYWDQRFSRMFGQHSTARKVIFTGDMKEACKVARELKTMLPTFKIEFLSLELMNSFKTEMC